jgi:hypothetical protein
LSSAPGRGGLVLLWVNRIGCIRGASAASRGWKRSLPMGPTRRGKAGGSITLILRRSSRARLGKYLRSSENLRLKSNTKELDAQQLGAHRLVRLVGQGATYSAVSASHESNRVRARGATAIWRSVNAAYGDCSRYILPRSSNSNDSAAYDFEESSSCLVQVRCTK